MTEQAKSQFLWVAERHDQIENSIAAESLLQLGRIFEKEGKTEDALKYYRLYLEDRPGDQAAVSAMERLRDQGQVEMMHSPWEIKDRLK
jgi:TolA-binding protein